MSREHRGQLRGTVQVYGCVRTRDCAMVRDRVGSCQECSADGHFHVMAGSHVIEATEPAPFSGCAACLYSTTFNDQSHSEGQKSH